MVSEEIGMPIATNEKFDGEVDDHGWENLLSTAQHKKASCWISPVGSEMKNETHPFPCGDHIRSRFSHKDVGNFKDISRTSWGIVGIPSEFHIQWMIDREIMDERGEQLQIVKNSVKSQIILCRSEVIPSCHAMVPEKMGFIKNSSIPVLDPKVKYDPLATEKNIWPDIDNIDLPPYLSTAFIPNNLKTRTDAKYHEVYFDESMNINVPISGIFSVVMHTQYQVAANIGANVKLFQVDTSTSLESNVMIFTEPVKYLSVSTPSLIVGCSLSSILIICLLLLLCALVHFRKKNIMKISQVSFLYVFVIFGIIALGTFVYPTYDDFHCKIMKVNVVALTGMYSILIGRLWRINHVLSPLLPQLLHKSGRETKEPLKNNLIFRFFKMITDWESYFGYDKTKSNQNTKKNIRRRLPSYLLVRLIFVLTLPVVIVTIYSFFTIAKIDYQYIEGSTAGRKICGGVNSFPTAFALFYYFIIQLTTVVVAYLTNGLPDRINETQLILTASWTTLSFVVVGSIILLIGLTPSTSFGPDIDYLMRMFVVNVTVLNTTWHVIMPKIRMARSGHDLNLKSILRERSSYSSQKSDTMERQSISIEDPRLPSIRFAELNRSLKPLRNNCRMSRCRSWNENIKRDFDEDKNLYGCRDSLPMKKMLPSLPLESRCCDVHKNIKQALSEISPSDLDDDECDETPNHFKNGYIITKGHMPPRRFISQILSTLDILWRICSVVSAEETPSLYDWHVFKARVTDLSKQCNMVRFNWEDDRFSMEDSKEELDNDSQTIFVTDPENQIEVNN